MRHGQTFLNTQGKYNGLVDEDISEKGIIQARYAAYDLPKDIDVIICSPMKRTKSTLSCILEMNTSPKNIPIQYDNRLKERTVGLLDGQPMLKEYEDAFWNYYSLMNIPKMQTLQELKEETASFIEDLKKIYPSKNILIVTHGFRIMGFKMCFEGVPESGDIRELGVPKNCQIVEYEV